MDTILLSLATGYVLGSLSPGYLLGRLVKGVDIRKHGNRGTGATNAYNVVGPVYGIIAGVFDVAKGAAAFLLAVWWLKVEPDAALLAGLAAFLGHNHPFYLGFKGGKGTATLLGLLVTALFFTRSWYVLLLAVAACVYILRISSRVRWQWSGRKILKLSALVLPLGFLGAPGLVLTFVNVVFVALVALDVLRLSNPRFNRWYLERGTFAKEKETSRLSGYTLFFLSAFILFNYFPRDIAVMALTLFVVADTAGPIGGAMFLRKEILRGKNWGGAALIFGLCALAGLFLRSLAGLDILTSYIFLSALAVAVLDLFSFLLDDNVLVPVGSALVMKYLQS